MTVNIACSQKGLISEKYSKEMYSVPKLMNESVYNKNPTFIVYGDIRPGFRISEIFLETNKWYTRNMFLFPFYELYLLWNGIIGSADFFRKSYNFGYKERKLVREAIYNEAKKTLVDFILNTGDLVVDGRRPDHWQKFLKENKIEHPLLSEIPYFPTIGSHEWANDERYGLNNYKSIFRFPRFYVIGFQDADIFVIDSSIILDQHQLIADEAQDRLFSKWIVSDEESHEMGWLQKKLAASNKTFKIVSMHHPPISFGKHHDNWMKNDWGRNLPDKRKRLLKLFQKYGVQIVFCGHEHHYEHNILRYEGNEENSEKEIHIIVSGGGGVPLRDKMDPEIIQEYLEYFRNEGLDVIQVKNEKIYHYCLISINADQIKIDVNEVTKETEKPLGLKESFLVHKQ